MNKSISLIKSATFVKSASHLTECPKPSMPEYAFIGRSNVGKSSLVNMITGQKGLAKTSGKPGKTQLINHFLIDGEWYLVDLPGYGWAKVSKESKAKWKAMINEYLLRRENLFCVFLLIDIRLEPQEIDLEFMSWLGVNEIPFVMVFTKADKLGKTQVQSHLAAYNKKLRTTWDELPQQFVTSSETNAGKEELILFIREINSQSSINHS